MSSSILSKKSIALILTSAVAVLTLGLTYPLRKSAHAFRTKLEVAEENCLLLTQQLERIAEMSVRPLVFKQILSSEEKQLLAQWLLFDTQFVENNRDRHEQRMESAYTARRAGHMAYLLERYDQSETMLRLSLELFGSLEKEFPENFIYRSEQAIAWMQFVDLAIAKKDRQQAIQYCRRACNLLDLQSPTSDLDRDQALSRLLPHIYQNCMSLGEGVLAREVAEVTVEVLDRLIAIQGPSDELRTLAQQLQQIGMPGMSARVAAIAAEGS